jgi:uncharacterized protein (DUF1697 family)
MADLKALFESHGFKNVKTYIQSGNIVFDYNDKHTNQNIALKISNAILDYYQYEVPVLVRSGSEMKSSLEHNPFVEEANEDPSRVAITFLASEPRQENVKKLDGFEYAPDSFIIKDTGVYLHCPGGFGVSKLSTNFFERKLKVKATARNWKTVSKLVDMAHN